MRKESCISPEDSEMVVKPVLRDIHINATAIISPLVIFWASSQRGSETRYHVQEEIPKRVQVPITPGSNCWARCPAEGYARARVDHVRGEVSFFIVRCIVLCDFFRNVTEMF